MKDSTLELLGSETFVICSSAGTVTVMTKVGSSVVSGLLSEGLNKQGKRMSVLKRIRNSSVTNGHF